MKNDVTVFFYCIAIPYIELFLNEITGQVRPYQDCNKCYSASFSFLSPVECPISTYKDFTGYAKSCIPCPANSRHSRKGSISRGDCKCLEGYEGNPAGYVECTSKEAIQRIVVKPKPKQYTVAGRAPDIQWPITAKVKT